jgi:hypothetical protein
MSLQPLPSPKLRRYGSVPPPLLGTGPKQAAGRKFGGLVVSGVD